MFSYSWKKALSDPVGTLFNGAKGTVIKALEDQLGPYLDGSICPEQVHFEYLNGEITATVTNLRLHIVSLNDALSSNNFPVELVEGVVDVIFLTFPGITELTKEPSYMEIRGLKLVLAPKKTEGELLATSMIDSFVSSKSSFIMSRNEFDKLQEEIKNTSSDDTFDFDGESVVTQLLENVLHRAQFVLKDAQVLLQRQNTSSLVIDIKELRVVACETQTENDVDDSASQMSDEQESEKVKEGVTLIKKLQIEDITLSIEHPADLSKSTLAHSNLFQSCLQSCEINAPDKYERARDSCVTEIFGIVSGVQNITLSNENEKTEVSVDLTDFLCFLSPRQTMWLLKFFDEFSNPIEKKIATDSHERSLYDDSILDREVYSLNDLKACNLQLSNTHGWSRGVGESFDDKTYPNYYARANDVMTHSFMSTGTSLESSSVYSGSSVGRRKRSRTPTSSHLELKVELSTFVVMQLHENISDDGCSSRDKENELAIATKVLGDAYKVVKNFDCKNDDKFVEISAHLDGVCDLSHLRFLATSFKFYHEQKSQQTFGNASVAHVELIEHLPARTSTNYTMERHKINVLTFFDCADRRNDSLENAIEMTFKSTRTRAKNVSQTKSEVTFFLGEFRWECDVTLIDRLSMLLFSDTESDDFKSKTCESVPIRKNEKCQCDLSILSKRSSIKLRIPIVDLRPLENRTYPWWSHNVTDDYFLLRIRNLDFSTSFINAEIPEYTIRAENFTVSYLENDSSQPVVFCACKNSDSIDNRLPQVVFSIHPKIEFPSEMDESGCDSESAMFEAFTRDKIPSPVTVKHVVHDLKSQRSGDGEQLVGESHDENLLIPGNKTEIQNFIKYATKTSRMRFDVKLPNLSIIFPSKHFYETIYNRILNELLTWEPAAYSPDWQKSRSESKSDLNSEKKSQFTYDDSFSENDSEEEYDETPSPELKNHFGQSLMSLLLTIVDGQFEIHTPVRDIQAKKVIPGQHGEFLLSLSQTQLFTVSAFNGNENVSYVCVQTDKAAVNHNGMVKDSNKIQMLPTNSVPDHLTPVIYQSEKNVRSFLQEESNKWSATSANRAMLSTVVKVERLDEDGVRSKLVQFACALTNATVRYIVTTSNLSWFTQLQDMFDVEDYPIAGYVPRAVITEIYLHLFSCALDYRPKYLPTRALVTVQNFSLCSQLSAKTNSTALRFIAEECALGLSEQCHALSINVVRDYVCIVSIGMLQFLLKFHTSPTDEDQPHPPLMDFTAFNNAIHIRTCSDSGYALTQLLGYLASDGDLCAPADDDDEATSLKSSISRRTSDINMEENLLGINYSSNNDLSSQQQRHVIETLDEAMKESVRLERLHQDMEEDQTVPLDPESLFCFPDESGETSVPKQILPNVAADLGEPLPPHVPAVPVRDDKTHDTDDEFCFLGDEIKELKHKQATNEALPTFNWHVKKRKIVLRSSHFAIPGPEKQDILQPPKDFPSAVYRYTLAEMNITWQMYGGYDFRKSNKRAKYGSNSSLHSARNDDETAKESTNLSKVIIVDTDPMTRKVLYTTQASVDTSEKPVNREIWITRGGFNRDKTTLMELQLNKIKFRFEQYAESSSKAAWRILLINDIELRDMLEKSYIKVFLYQYTTKSKPKQNNANMVSIKWVDHRPNKNSKAEESSLKISILPIRLNIDQDSLIFLINFFKELSCGVADIEESKKVLVSQSPARVHQPPIMIVNVESPTDDTESMQSSSIDPDMVLSTYQAKQLVNDNLIMLESEFMTRPITVDPRETNPNPENFLVSDENANPNAERFFKSVTFCPELLIRLDYTGKHVDMSHPAGPFAGLMMGLASLNCTELRLIEICNRNGVLGFDKLLRTLGNEWLNDIKKNQLPNIIGGVGPMHALIQIFVGISDLIWLPIEQYQKDGRIVRGLQRGANSFTTSTAMAALELTLRIIHLIQATAETAYDMLTPGPSFRKQLKYKRHRRRGHSHKRPVDIREGVTTAYNLVKEGFEETASNFIRVASMEHEQKGYKGAVGGVLRQIPSEAVKPIIIATEAANKFLEGVVGQLDPDTRREESQKWKNQDS